MITALGILGIIGVAVCFVVVIRNDARRERERRKTISSHRPQTTKHSSVGE